MKVISTVKELQNLISELQPAKVGLVPTMGALHEGHLSLAKTAVKLCKIVVVTIYVNPAQFNDKNDLKNYPISLKADLNMLKKVLRKYDIVFTPNDDEIYPVEDRRVFRFGNLDNVMEALHRPGHFNGVAHAVSRFFDIVNPDIAVFGLKDFQQLAVIKDLVKQSGYKVKIIENPIIRENDGLAMSSRNRNLDQKIRKKASIIFKTICTASGMITDNDIPEIKSFVENNINNVPNFKVEYFDIVDDIELVPVNNKTELDIKKRYFGCIAVRAGNIRLIDNIEIELV